MARQNFSFLSFMVIKLWSSEFMERVEDPFSQIRSHIMNHNSGSSGDKQKVYMVHAVKSIKNQPLLSQGQYWLGKTKPK